MDTQDQPTGETPGTNPANPTGPSTNWEAAYKGLQTTVNQKDTELKAARAELTELKTAKKGLEDQLAALSQQYEGSLADVSAKGKSAEDQLAQINAQLAEANTRLSTYQKRDEVRTLVGRDFPQLLGDFESGLLRIEGLEGEALTSYLTKYKERFAAFAEAEFRKTMEGTVPTTPPGTPALTDVQKLEDWLYDPPNLNHPEYRQRQEQYLSMKDQQTKT